MVTSLKPSPVLQLHEYNITDATGKILQRIRRDDDADVLTEGTNSRFLLYIFSYIYLVNFKIMLYNKISLDSGIQPPAEEILKDTRQQIGLEKVLETPTVISVVNGSAPTVLAFKELEQTVRRTNYI